LLTCTAGSGGAWQERSGRAGISKGIEQGGFPMQPWLWVWLLVFPLILAFMSLFPVLGAKAPR